MVGRSWFDALKQNGRTVGRVIAPGPDSWKEIWPSGDPLEKLFSVRVSGVGILVMSVMGVAGLLLATWVWISSGSDIDVVLVRGIVAYNAFFVAAILTAILLVLVSVLFLARGMGLLHVDIAWKRALTRLGTAVGLGTLAGTVGATLTPLAVWFFDVGEGSDRLISPEVLFDLPAAGAVVGYVVGLVCAVPVLGQGASNLLYRHALTPVLFTCLIVVTNHFAVTPQRLFDQLLVDRLQEQVPGGICSIASPGAGVDVQSLLSRPAVLLVAAHTCHGDTVMLDWTTVSWLLCAVLIAVAGSMLGRDVVHGLRNAQAQETRPAGTEW